MAKAKSPTMKTTPAPPETKLGREALAYFRNKNNQPSFSWRDVESEEHAFAFTVAKATKLEVLKTIRAEVERALESGETIEQFKAALEPRLIALGWWGKKKMRDPLTGDIKLAQLGSPRRLEIIYDANMRTAYAAGSWYKYLRKSAPVLTVQFGRNVCRKVYQSCLVRFRCFERWERLKDEDCGALCEGKTLGIA